MGKRVWGIPYGRFYCHEIYGCLKHFIRQNNACNFFVDMYKYKIHCYPVIHLNSGIASDVIRKIRKICEC